MDRDATYRADILSAIKQVEVYTAGLSSEMFLNDSLTHDAVIRQLQIVGEASKRLSDKFKATTPEVEWKKIAGMRDVLIHDYGIVDMKMVWKIVKDDLPALKSALE